jgi:hypothetical protein
MRLLTIGIMAIGVATAACDRGPGANAAGLNGAAVDAKTAVATSGRNDAALPTAHAVRRDVTLPAGTLLPIVLDTAVDSVTSRVEQAVLGHLRRAIVVEGKTVLPQGTSVSGVVTDATRSGKVKGRAHLAVRFDTLTVRDANINERYRIETAAIGRTASGTKKKDATEIGVPAAGGAIIGGLVGGKKGAVIGGAAGGGAGTAIVLTTRGKEVSLPKGTALTVRLAEPVTVKVRG